MKEQFTQEEWINEGTTVYALQDSTRHGKPIKINRFQFNIQGKCSDEELLANAVLAKAAPKMYHMIESLKSELMWMITNENNRIKANSSITDLQPRDQLDAESVYLADKLLAEARGENSENN